MAVHRSAALVRRVLRTSRLAQIGILVLFWLAGEAVARTVHLPIPGGVFGMVAVLLLLATRRIRLASMLRGADWLLAEMLLFFLPTVLAVLDHRELIGLTGLKILAVIVLGTIVVMSVTALAVDLGCRMMAAMEARHGSSR